MRHSLTQLGLSLILGSGFLLQTAHAGLFDDEEARRAILDLRQKITTLEQRASKMEQASSQSAQGQLALSDALNQRDQEIARLRGELEVAQNSIRKLQEDYRLLYTSLDNRFKQLEPKAIEVDGATVKVQPQAQTDYQAGLDAFKAAKYDDAQRLFARFLEVHKGNPLEPQVRYLLGSSQYAAGKYKEAIVTQRDLAKDFPDNPKAPEALLSQASSQIELKSIDGAKKTLKTLIDSYPNSPAAGLAKERLTKLK